MTAKIHLILLLIVTFLLPSCNNEKPRPEKEIVIEGKIDPIEELIIDSDITFEDAIAGIDIPENLIQSLELLTVEYFSFDGKLHRGQLVINSEVKKDIEEIFLFIKETKFPLEKVIPISQYVWSDEKSMLDNNTSAFNYRVVKGSKVTSAHSYGLAIDINPLLNPHIKRGIISPAGASYDVNQVGTLSANSPLVKEFKERKWTWGGSWRSSKDYQHFEKKF